MKAILALLIAAVSVLPSFGKEKATPLMLDNVALEELMRSYEQWTGRKVWLALDLGSRPIYIEHPEAVPFAKAAEMVSKILLENYGISVQEMENREAFLDWTADPKYKDRRHNPIHRREPPRQYRVRTINNRDNSRSDDPTNDVERDAIRSPIHSAQTAHIVSYNICHIK